MKFKYFNLMSEIFADDKAVNPNSVISSLKFLPSTSNNFKVEITTDSVTALEDIENVNDLIPILTSSS